ncbi:MAG TPA: hypothetical protein PK760_09500, partial [Flavobacteriales bacterium]|nr:hypothetical protein [Flavobacteriales bacterium]
MTGATLTSGIVGACGTAVQDEWFTFTATAVTQRVQIGGSTSGLNYALFTAATCAGPFTIYPGFGCIPATTVTDYNGLTIGQ